MTFNIYEICTLCECGAPLYVMLKDKETYNCPECDSAVAN